MAHHDGGAAPGGADAADGAVSLRTLLAEPLLRGRVLAGESGLDRTASWCLPLSELRAAGDLSGVVVHLPAAALRPSERARELILGLTRRNAAALLVWPAPGEPGVDLDAAARAAGDAPIPVVVLRADADYRSVSRLVGQKALAQTSHVLEYGARVHRTLAEVLARGSGVPAMAQAVAGLARCPVLVLDADGETLAYAGLEAAPGIDPAEMSCLLAERLPELRHEELRGREVAELDAPPAAPGAAPAAHLLVAPIVVAGDLYGRLVLIEPGWPPDNHDIAQHRVIAEHGATLTGSEMLRLRSVRDAEERARGDFAEALVHGRFADSYELEARARHHGFDGRRCYSVYVVTSAALRPTGRRDHRRTAAVTRIAQGVEPSANRWALAAPVGTFVVVIRQVSDAEPADPPADAQAEPPAGPRAESAAESPADPPTDPPTDPLAAREAVGRFARELHRTLAPHLDDDLRIAYGRPGTGAAGVATSYYEARVTMGLARHAGKKAVCGYDDLRIYAALRDAAGSAEGRAFAREILESLRRVHTQTGDLEQVVLAYIKAAGNLNAAARALKLHRNTMLYKLERASRALGMDIRSADTQFMVWLAHHIDTLATVTGALTDELSPPA